MVGVGVGVSVACKSVRVVLGEVAKEQELVQQTSVVVVVYVLGATRVSWVARVNGTASGERDKTVGCGVTVARQERQSVKGEGVGLVHSLLVFAQLLLDLVFVFLFFVVLDHVVVYLPL